MGKYFNKKAKEAEKDKYEFPEYTNKELWALNDLLKEKYNDGKTPADIKQWMVDEGALTKEGAVLMFHDGEKYVPPAKYSILQDKLEKAGKLLGRKEYAVKKQLEDVAKGMEVKVNDFDRAEIENEF